MIWVVKLSHDFNQSRDHLSDRHYSNGFHDSFQSDNSFVTEINVIFYLNKLNQRLDDIKIRKNKRRSQVMKMQVKRSNRENDFISQTGQFIYLEEYNKA